MYRPIRNVCVSSISCQSRVFIPQVPIEVTYLSPLTRSIRKLIAATAMKTEEELARLHTSRRLRKRSSVSPTQRPRHRASSRSDIGSNNGTVLSLSHVDSADGLSEDISELESLVEAQRRVIEAVNISNNDNLLKVMHVYFFLLCKLNLISYLLQVLGMRARPVIATSLLSTLVAFLFALYHTISSKLH